MRLLVFQHTPGEHPAAFADHARNAGDRLTVVHLYRGDPIPDLSCFYALIVMGGPMDVWDTDEHPWLIAEKAAIGEWVLAGRPFLGVCLGHQLLVEALRGTCARLTNPEISVSDITCTAPDPIFDRLPDRFPVMKWHGVAAETLPEGTTVLAASKACPVQAIRVGSCAWGVQFHPEITDTVIADWLNDPANMGCAFEWLGGKQAARQFAKDSIAYVPDALIQSVALYAGLQAAWTAMRDLETSAG